MLECVCVAFVNTCVGVISESSGCRYLSGRPEYGAVISLFEIPIRMCYIVYNI